MVTAVAGIHKITLVPTRAAPAAVATIPGTMVLRNVALSARVSAERQAVNAADRVSAGWLTVRRRRAYTSIMRIHIALAAVLLIGCGGAGKNDCNDGLDNDGDGLVDEADPGCAFNQGKQEAPDPPAAQCGNGLDDDGDALVDYPADPGCTDAMDDDETDPPPPPPQCNDGLDNNGNGLIDYPFDPGCDSQTDTTEDNPPPVTQCSDGMDNDGDGTTDYPMDPGCTSAADNDEYNAIVGECGPGLDVQPLPASGIATGDRTGPGPNELQSPTCGGLGQELVWTFDVASAASLVVTTDFPETTLDTVVYVRSNCRMPGTELGCDDDDPPVKASTLIIPRVDPGSYYIIVDSYGPGSLGHFKLSVETRVAQGDACDPAVPNVCAPGLTCRSLLPGDPTTCQFHECHDGLDNDADGAIDYPVDAGCATPDDDSELIPPGDPIPQCGNGVDDDADALVDYPADPGCAAASDDSELDECEPGVTVLSLTNAGASGTNVGAPMVNQGGCDSDSMMGAEVVYGYHAAAPLAKLTFSTTATFANILYVRAADCAAGTEVACAPNNDGRTSQTVSIPAPTMGTTYYVFVDGDWGSAGTFTLSVGGELPGGAACTPGDTQFICTTGFTCDLGSSTCAPTACNDGADDDGDGLVDYPNDPGCASIADDSEVDPSPEPQCHDGLDNDADALVDYPADPGCASAADGSEIDACVPGVPVLDLPESGATGMLSFGTSHFSASCTDTSFSPEDVYAFTLSRSLTKLTFSTVGGTDFDDVLYVREGTCGVGPDVACASAHGTPGETVDLLSPALATYFVFVDTQFSTGTYTLHVSGVVAPGGACDPASTQFTCAGGTLCGAATHTCDATACNDGADNDGDGRVDVFDPGCTSILDDDETDPATEPQCGNGLDDDGDSLVDYPADPGCARASDPLEQDCNDSDPIVDVSHLASYSSTTASAHDDFSPSCSAGSAAPDVVHRLTFPGHLDLLQVDTNSSPLDSVVSIKAGGCDAVDYACDDDSGTPDTESLILKSNVPAGTYFLVVDGWHTSAGAYNLHVSGTITAGQPCDPLQTFLTCGGGTTCTDVGAGFHCN